MILVIRYKNGKAIFRKIRGILCFHRNGKQIDISLEDPGDDIRITSGKGLIKNLVFNNGEEILKDDFKEHVNSLEIRIGNRKYTFIDFSEEEIEELIKGEGLE